MSFDRPHRREFVALLGGAAAWSLAAGAQQSAYSAGQRKTHRIAVIATATPIGPMTETRPILFFREFFLELRRLGYGEGGNIVVPRFSSEGEGRGQTEGVTGATAA